MSNTEKIEMIGSVKLDLSDYPGEDFYCDGDTEKLLLDLVSNHSEDEFNRLIGENQYWAVLYHLSHIRGNVVDFIPLKAGDKVLEIGSGCGAITSALAKSGADVTCIELSKQRSLINANRNKGRDNIEIKVGNFEDVEKHLEEKYDYIFMIGVLEYGGAYISSKDPYIDFLKKAHSHLKDGGILYVAIENKYGLKYLAGCREDHTGRFYEGIEGYKNPKGVKTFSHNELKNMAKKVGFDVETYYPYPDYKLPVTIYSDKMMPVEGELKNSYLNFDNDRVVAFDEAQAFNEVIAEGEFDRFANSFLLELKKGEVTESFSTRHVVYSKHSNDRDDSLKIRTDIEIDGYKKLYVVKRPCHEKAIAHVENLVKNSELLDDACKNSAFSINKCQLKKNEAGIGAEFEYIEGVNLQEKIDKLFEDYSGEELKEKVMAELDKYKKAVLDIENTETFERTKEFDAVFGNTELPTNMKAFKVSNIDLIFTNVFDDEAYSVIDYEWTFAFPVPVAFVLYRALLYGFDGEKKTSFLNENKLYDFFGIDEKMKEAFMEIELAFQRYIAGSHISLIGLHSIMGRDAYKLEDMVSKEAILQRKWHVGVYYDNGTGFSQENFVYYRAEASGDSVKLSVPVNGAKIIRIDPADDPCMVKINKICLKKKTEEKKVSEVSVNGINLEDGMIYYDKMDPQIIVDKTEGYDSLEIEYDISAFRRDLFEAIGKKLPHSKNGFFIRKKGPYDKVRI